MVGPSDSRDGPRKNGIGPSDCERDAISEQLRMLYKGNPVVMRRGLCLVASELSERFVPVLKVILDDDHELVSNRAVDDTVIVSDRDVTDGSDRDAVVALFIGNDCRHLVNGADAHNGKLRLIDDRHTELGTEDSGIGDGESTALNIFRFQFLGASAFSEIGDGALETDKAQFIGALDDRNDETPIEGNCDTEIDILFVINVLAFNRGVDDGPRA